MRRQLGLLAGLLLPLAASVLFACTGEDPSVGGNDTPDGAIGPDGSSGGGSDGGGGGDAAPGTPALVLQAEPLTLVAGAADALRLKVVKRENLGAVSFRVKGLPDGVSAPATSELAADADELTIAITSQGTAQHGDFALTVEANGKPFTFPASLALRGGAGAADSGFGVNGRGAFEVTAPDDFQIVGLADDRILIGFSPTATSTTLRIVDKAGKAVGQPLTVGTAGKLEHMAPRADGGFSVLIRTATGMTIVNYAKDGTANAATASTSLNGPGRLAATPLGTLFAQASSGDNAIVITRWGQAAQDAAFQPVTLMTPDPQLFVLSGNADGSGWLSYQRDFQQVALTKALAGGMQRNKDLPVQESCSYATAVGGDMVCYYTSSEAPMYSLRRFDIAGNLVTSFGTNGRVTLASTAMNRLLATGPDRLYIVTNAASALTVLAYGGVNGAPRSTFATAGALTVATPVGDPSIRPTIGYDARGRLIFAFNEYFDLKNHVTIRRFWD